MKKTLLIISMTLPMFLLGAGQSFASTKVINIGNSQFFRQSVSHSQLKLDTQQPPLILLAARDDQQKECDWLGVCKGDE
jgi:hypothetical protein